MNPYSLPAFSHMTLRRVLSSSLARSRSITCRESGHTPSGVRVVRPPHDVVLAHVADEVGHNGLLLKCGEALASPEVAGLHAQIQMGKPGFVLGVHSVAGVGEPAGARFAQHEPEVGEAVASPREDDGGPGIRLQPAETWSGWWHGSKHLELRRRRDPVPWASGRWYGRIWACCTQRPALQRTSQVGW